VVVIVFWGRRILGRRVEERMSIERGMWFVLAKTSPAA
jgi:hypothetical protein